MAEDKRSILVYADWISIFEELENEEAGKLIKHFFRYVNDQKPDAPDRLTKLLFEPIRQTLKRDLVKYEDKREKNRQNAIKRWDEYHAVVSERIKMDANHAVSGSVSDSDSGSVSIKKEKKNKYAENISLLPDEYEKLLFSHGKENTDILIEILNVYKGSTGKKYKSDYMTILNWVIDRAKKDGKYKLNGEAKTKFVF